MGSIWQSDTERPRFPTLKGDTEADVLIIGGGMAGILTGYMLKRAGMASVIAEAGRILGGVTQNTTAKVTLHHGAIFDKMLRRFGAERAGLYVKANREAVEAYRRLATSIDCDFQDTVSYVYSRTDRAKIEREVLALQQLGCPAVFTDKLSLPFPVAGAVSVREQAMFHPLKFAYALAKELTIYENTEVLALTKEGALTANGKIKAKKIIVATHFPFLNKHGLYFLKMYQHRSYVLALRNVEIPDGILVDESETGLSFRGYKELLLLGGGGHRTGKRGGGYEELYRFAKEHYRDAEVVCRYATQDCMTLDDIPYIGEYAARAKNLYVATGFHKWGMTSSMVAAQMLTDLLQGKKNAYAEVFSPSRSMLRKQLFINAGESVLGLLTPTRPRCSHLGCALHYNKQEHTWDCACHGSRYTEEGQLLNNPARRDIKKRRR